MIVLKHFIMIAINRICNLTLCTPDNGHIFHISNKFEVLISPLAPIVGTDENHCVMNIILQHLLFESW